MGNENTAVAKKPTKKGLSRNAKRNIVAYSFIAPNFIGFAVFTLIPIIYSFGLGFFKWNGNGTPKFVGIANFTRLFSDTFFKASFVNTLLYCLGTVPLTLMAAIGLAMLLNKKIKGRAIFRTIAFFPYVASLVAVTAVWSMIFHPSKGPINAMLHYVFHMQTLPNWFGKDLIMFTMVLFSVWRFMGYYMIIYLAGLQGIPGELYEAAKLDGAGKWHQFRYITWPQLRTTTFFVTVMLTVSSFKVYDIAIMLGGGGDGKLGLSSTVLVYYIYQKAFQEWDLGYSSAIAMVLFVLVLMITLLQFRGQMKKDKE